MSSETYWQTSLHVSFPPSCSPIKIVLFHRCKLRVNSSAAVVSLDGDLQEPDEPSADPYACSLNYAAFLARLVRCGFFGYSRGTGIRTMREALETAVSDDDVAADFVPSAAALWILIAGQALYTLVVEAPLVGKDNTYKCGELYHGPETGVERWEFWKKALAAASAKKGASAECQRLAKGAVEMMDVIQENKLF